MDGAGIMNLPTNVGGGTSQDGLDSYAPLIAAQQTARDMGYPRFTRELLAAGSEMDQAEVQEFLQTIRDAGLTSEDVALMRRVVEAVFGDPNNYPEVRARLLAEGVPEDLLPETFDLEFFTALRMAAEEAENIAQEPRPTEQEMPMDMPVQMAEGGIVGLPELKPIARAMASMGRQGDTMLAHITPQEAMMLKRMGGSGSINPYTGLPEFFLKKVFKGISRGLKSIAKGVKKFAKSTVGRIVLSVALGAFLGPMATGFLSGTMGVTLSAAAATGISAGIGVFGSSLLAGDGFKNSLRNGLTAGALTYGTAGLMGDFSTPAANAPQTFREGVSQGIQNVKRPFQAAADFVRGGPEAAANVPAPGVGTAAEQLASAPPAAEGAFGRFVEPSSATQLPTTTSQPTFTPGISTGGAGVSVPTQLDAPFFPGDPTVPGGISGTTGGAERGFFDKTIDFFSPSAREAAGKEAAERAFQETLARTKSTALAEKAYQAALPGTVSKYLPAAAGITTAAIGTGVIGSPFEAPEIPTFGMTPEQRAEIAANLKVTSPEFFGSFLPRSYSQPVMTAARGSGPQGVKKFPRKNGHISGPGTGTSDDIPAMLSDGEFVFTAKAVRNMGGGSRRKGAAKMYKLMKMLEGGPVGKTAKA